MVSVTADSPVFQKDPERGVGRARNAVSRPLVEGGEPVEASLALVAHDLRTPLNAIVLSASLLHNRWQEGEFGDPTQMLDGIQREAGRMAHMIDDLLDVSALRAGGMSLSLVEARPEALLQAALTELQPLAAARRIELTARWAQRLGPVRVDPQRIAQVFGNLVENALRFTPAGGHVSMSATHAAGGVSFHVSDEGPGIADEDRTRLFDPFYRGRGARGRGTGLGLFIVRRIVEAHGGRVYLETGPGLGSTFSFALDHG